MPDNDALALEYQSDYRTAKGDLNILDLVNNPGANGECRVFGLGIAEEGFDLAAGQCRALFQDSPNSLLVRQEAL